MPDGHSSNDGGSRIFSCLPDILAYFGQSAPDRDAILAPGRLPVTYGELWARTNDTVRVLRGLNIGPSDRVAVVLPNGPDAAIAILMVAAGSVCVPLNPGYTAREWQHHFQDLQISALLTCAGAASASRDAATAFSIPIIDLVPQPSEGSSAFRLLGAATSSVGKPALAPKSGDAFILLTSGTASLPKGVPLTQAAVCRSAYNVGSTLALEPRDRLLNVLPLFHVHGLVSGVLAALASGSSVICTTGFDAAKFFGDLKQFSPTWYTAVPAIHQAVLSAARAGAVGVKPCSLRVIRSASSTLPSSVSNGLEGLFEVPVIDTYGMTEAASQIAANPVKRRKPGSVGQPAGSEVRITDDEGRPLPAGGRGEITLRGPTVTRGYVNDPAATKAAFRDGWFRTGDLGYLDDDGYLFIVGRIKDIINRGGQKIAPVEVEQILLGHPDVVEAAVFSIHHPRLGEDVAAAVVLSQGAEATAQGLRDFAAERLARFKVPGLVRIVSGIPKGPAGKIKRSELAAALAIALPTADADRGREIMPPRSEMEWQVANILEELLELSQIGVEEDILALGADSITIMRILARVRDRFGVELSFKDVFERPTIAALVARLASSSDSPATTAPGTSHIPLHIAHVVGDRPQPLSVMQEQALLRAPELLTLPQFNRLLAYRLQGPLNVAALKQGLAEIVHRHDALRTGFSFRDQKPVALIASVVDIDSFFVLEDLAVASTVAGERVKPLLLKKVKLIAEQEGLMPFDINLAPLFRARLLRLGPHDHVLLLIVHEMIADGWSIGIFVEELSELYFALSTGRAAHLPEPSQFSDFARLQQNWLACEAASEHVSYWKARLQGVSPVFAASDDVDGALWDAHISQKSAHVSKDLLTRLNVLEPQAWRNPIHDIADRLQGAVACPKRTERHLCCDRDGEPYPSEDGARHRPCREYLAHLHTNGC